MCLVVTARPCIRPRTHLIGLPRVRWVEGEGGAWRRREKEEGEGRRKGGVRVEEGGWGAKDAEADLETRQAADVT